MLYALNNVTNGDKIEATPKAEGFCPECNQTMVPKCGDIKIWHWAHRQNLKHNCDYGGETEWHLDWKKRVNKKELVEVKKGNHRADIVTRDDTVIELQHSSIDTRTILDREEAYNKIVWILHSDRNSIRFRLKEYGYSFYWVYARRSFGISSAPIILDFVSEREIPYNYNAPLFIIRKQHQDGGRNSSQWRGWGKMVSRKYIVDAIINNVNFISTVIYNPDKPKNEELKMLHIPV